MTMLTTTTPAPGKAVLEHGSQAVTLPRGELLVGRGAGCYLRIDDPDVSRLHLRLRVGASSVTIEDLGSTNGTYVNGQPLRGVQELRDGDEITLGARSLRIRIAAPDPFAREESTPVGGPPRPRRELMTLQGLGVMSGAELEQTCPTCGPVPFNADGCPSCGVRWPRGRRQATTHPVNEAVDQLRRHERYTVRVSVQYVSPSLQVNGVASNLSETGVFINTRQVDPVGTRCRLVFCAPDGSRAAHEGFVRRVIHRGVDGSCGMGIEFGRLA
jgi:hypothetical protein